MRDLDSKIAFEVLPVRRNPPEAAGDKINRPYVYKLYGVHDNSGTFIEYLRMNIKVEDKVEFWSIWHGDKVSLRNMKWLHPEKLIKSDIIFLLDCENSCIKFFPNKK